MTILVTGATGNVGRHVVAHLLADGHRVRALTRDPEKAGLPAGVEVVAGDLDRTDTLAAAFDGVTAAHLINFGAYYAPLGNGAEIVELALRSGVRKVTILGGWDESTLEPAVRASALEWTHLRPVEFMANTLDWAEPVRTTGVIEEPFVNRLSAMVHESDIAAVAATALTSDGHAGQTYALTGPRALTPVEKAATLSAAIGREIRLVELTETQARERWAAEGTPAEMIDFMVEAWGNTPEVGYTVVPTVEQVTGRPARTFAQWAAEHADRFRV